MRDDAQKLSANGSTWVSPFHCRATTSKRTVPFARDADRRRAATLRVTESSVTARPLLRSTAFELKLQFTPGGRFPHESVRVPEVLGGALKVSVAEALIAA